MSLSSNAVLSETWYMFEGRFEAEWGGAGEAAEIEVIKK